MEDLALISSRAEASSLLNGMEFKSIYEFEEFSEEMLRKYIVDKECIKTIAASKAFSFEIMFLKKIEGTFLEDFTKYFFNNFSLAVEHHKSDVIKIYLESDLLINEALVGYQDSASLNSSVNTENQRRLTKSAFNMFGDIIESSLYPQLNLLYKVFALSKDSSIYGDDKILTNGKIVSSLVESSELFKHVLKDILHNVPLNQWRNISNHSSYSYNKETSSVNCNYGHNNSRSVTLEFEELVDLLKSIDTIQILLKTCLELSSMMLRIKESIGIHEKRYELTEETILSQIGNMFAVLSYEIRDIEKNKSHWKINIIDQRSLGKAKFREFGKELIPYLACMYDLYGLLIDIEVFDIKGRTFQKMSLATKNNSRSIAK
ncbi:hypothetical protein [Thalassolituus sp.]|uniref:hypothetical protein n=1 Tax=Thalassolituus sp. TaxID=2030822 RepID=UPI003512E0D0